MLEGVGDAEGVGPVDVALNERPFAQREGADTLEVIRTVVHFKRIVVEEASPAALPPAQAVGTAPTGVDPAFVLWDGKEAGLAGVQRRLLLRWVRSGEGREGVGVIADVRLGGRCW